MPREPIVPSRPLASYLSFDGPLAALDTFEATPITEVRYAALVTVRRELILDTPDCPGQLRLEHLITDWLATAQATPIRRTPLSGDQATTAEVLGLVHALLFCRRDRPADRGGELRTIQFLLRTFLPIINNPRWHELLCQVRIRLIHCLFPPCHGSTDPCQCQPNTWSPLVASPGLFPFLLHPLRHPATHWYTAELQEAMLLRDFFLHAAPWKHPWFLTMAERQRAARAFNGVSAAIQNRRIIPHRDERYTYLYFDWFASLLPYTARELSLVPGIRMLLPAGSTSKQPR